MSYNTKPFQTQMLYIVILIYENLLGGPFIGRGGNWVRCLSAFITKELATPCALATLDGKSLTEKENSNI